MLRITYREMFDRSFQSAISKLRGWDGFVKKDPRIALNFGKIVKVIEQEAKDAQEVWLKVLDQYAKKDENGKLLTTRDSSGMLGYNISEDKLGEYEEAEKKHADNVLEIQRQHLRLEDLTGSSLTPDELNAIECLLESGKVAKMENVKTKKR